jgi:hypothetical protein
MKLRPRDQTPDENELLIDRNKLDEEFERQARLYGRAANRAVKLQLRLDEAETALEVLEADVELKIRASPSMFSMDKVTDKSVAAKLATLGEVIETKKEVNQAKYRLGLARAHVQALDQKKRALEKMVDLWLAEYWAEPRTGSAKFKDRVAHAGKRKARRSDEDDTD